MTRYRRLVISLVSGTYLQLSPQLMRKVVIGLVLLLAHLASTLKDERRLIWSAKPSATKYAFLCYRYLIPALMFFFFISQSGFTGIHFTNAVRLILHIILDAIMFITPQACGAIIAIVAVISAAMQFLGSGLVLRHVIGLWQHNRVRHSKLWFVPPQMADFHYRR
jgi:hypothetical protein